jgi:hypothetical protein
MQKKYYRSAMAVKILTIIGLVVSAPFVAVVGLGLIAFLPLLFFFIFNRRYMKNIKNNSSMQPRDYRSYRILAVLGGAGSSFGFYMFWQLSHGVDTVETPFAPFIVMAVAGCPLITIWIISMAARWQSSFKQPAAQLLS